jgi:hypothetical protein
MWTIGLTILIIVGAFIRGDYLLGSGFAYISAEIAAGVVFLNYRTYFSKRKENAFIKIMIGMVTCCAILVIVIPALFHDLGILAEDHRVLRSAESGLSEIFLNDPKFTNLDHECFFDKCLFVEINGKIKTDQDLLSLRNEIINKCPAVGIGTMFLKWNVTVQDSKRYYDGNDDVVFADYLEKKPEPDDDEIY